MPWLRLDDKFVRHPKITRLVRNDRWTWLEVLCYCAEYKTEGFIPDTIREVVPKATGPFLERCHQLALLDLAEHEHATYCVHDWSEYNPKDPTKAERQARWRSKKIDGAVDTRVDGAVDSKETNGVDAAVDSPARARARVPSRPRSASTPSYVGDGTIRSEVTDAAAHSPANGAAPLIDRLSTYVRQFWDEYPDLTVLRDELTDRGLSEAQAANVIEAERLARQESA